MESKPIEWIGDSLKVLRTFPQPVRRAVGVALREVQVGDTPANAKPLRGVGRNVFEIVARYDTNTYRAVYALKIGERVYVLHVFQKKSKQGIRTPPRELKKINQRYQRALQHASEIEDKQ